ncbi:MAG TPA: CinA family protein [Verrucomicrobiae bacterium]|nr:CinA family protein [Verrucomicrobiae bacterium]
MPGFKNRKTRRKKLEELIVHSLTRRKQTLALAESCTGGGIADCLTNVPGASGVFPGGVVTYSDEAKQNLLNVRAETLLKHGAVSKAVAREMAEGALKKFRADYAIAVTGVAGPTGGTPAKPVGTVFIALATKQGAKVWKKFNPAGRLNFKKLTAKQALEQLYFQLKRSK